MVLHFQAIQPGQQDRRGQARGEKVDRAARDDRHDPVAAGEFFEQREDSRQRFGQLRLCDDGRQRSVEGHSPTVAAAPAPHQCLPRG
jgi:hypothetical protein